MKSIRNLCIVWFTILCLSSGLSGAPARTLVEVEVIPDRPDWTYSTGDPVQFEIRVLKDGHPLEGAEINYQVGPEQMPPTFEFAGVTSGEPLVVEAGTMKQPGYLRCSVEVIHQGKSYISAGTAGFDPDRIQPATPMPEDFRDFWNDALAEQAEIPLKPTMTLVPDQCTSDMNAYHVSFETIRMPGSWRGNSRFYGMLSVPKKPGKYPALLVVPGAGVRPYHADQRAEAGVIVLQVGIHGIPVNLNEPLYRNLATGALSGYWSFGLHDRDAFYYKRVYLGCSRAIDFIETLDSYDGDRLAVCGGSQGGALSIITASLDKRVDALVSFYPAMSDQLGYLEGRAGGWPHIFKDERARQRKEWVDTIPYFDVVNFARQLDVPGWYSWGYNDNVCPPTSIQAVYNSISAPKEKHLFLETWHWTYPEQWDAANAWLFDQLGINP